MTTITFPSTPKIQTMSWRLVQPAQNNVSGWTGKRQVIASGRGWWECNITMPPIVGSTNINAWRAFLAKTQGATNDFQIPVDPTPQSSLGSLPTTNGVNQLGRAIATDGWPGNATLLLAGQFVTINNQLLQLTADLTTNGSGQGTLYVEPPVHQPVADNSAIEYKNPYCLMYVVDQPSLSVEPGYVYSLSLSLRESF